jgi:putative transposase
LVIPKLKEEIKLNLHRKTEGEPLFATISKSTNGKYYVSITCEAGHKPFEKTGKSVGIDTGIKELAILSD